MIKSQTDTSRGENELLVSKIAEKKVPKILKPQGHFLKDFPVSDILDISMTEEKIRRYAYTKDEVDQLIADAVAEARRIDEESMRKHNRDATIISMINKSPTVIPLSLRFIIKHIFCLNIAFFI